MAEVRGALRVAIPPESQALKSPPRKPYTVTRIALAPAVKRVARWISKAPTPSRCARLPGASPLRSNAPGKARSNCRPPTLAEYSREADFDSSSEVSATIQNRRVLQLSCGKPRPLHGLALDIGTTSVAVFLCNLERGDIAAVCAPRAIRRPPMAKT